MDEGAEVAGDADAAGEANNEAGDEVPEAPAGDQDGPGAAPTVTPGSGKRRMGRPVARPRPPGKNIYPYPSLSLSCGVNMRVSDDTSLQANAGHITSAVLSKSAGVLAKLSLHVGTALCCPECQALRLSAHAIPTLSEACICGSLTGHSPHLLRGRAADVNSLVASNIADPSVGLQLWVQRCWRQPSPFLASPSCSGR